jgi:cell surface protein SprA
MQINRVEVWVTNKKSDYSSSRNIVAFLDLGETDHRHAPWGVALGVKWPSNKSHGLYGEVTSLPNLRDIETVSAALNSTSVSMTGGEDYEKLESARRLNESEYTVNPMLGYISLKSKLQDDEVLAVAYEYTSGGKTYQVGEFSTDGIEEPKTLVLKLLKGAAFSPGLPYWDLMMMNIYSLGASNVQQGGMKLEVAYQNDSSGVYVN